MELFTATGEQKTFLFLTTRDVGRVHHGCERIMTYFTEKNDRISKENRRQDAELYRKIKDFKVSYNPETNPIKDESRFLLAELHIINVVVCNLV